MIRFPFPQDFLFGAASSACQIESAPFEGGKGVTNYDNIYANDPARMKYADPANSADFYHLYRQDIQDMKKLGLKAFRFSIAWARIYPNGPEEVCQAGLDYYSDMIDALNEAGIVPYFDLYHCCIPQWVLDRGGLLNPDFSDWFTSYAKTCFEALGQKVAYWTTVNEPNINCMSAYVNGNAVPTIKDQAQAILGCHNMLLTHYRVVKLYKSMNLPGKIGAVIHVEPTYSLSNDPKDKEAADRYFAYYSGWWLDTMLAGKYPKLMLEEPYIAEKMPENLPKELAEAFEPMDFVGINLYNPNYARYDENEPMRYKTFINEKIPRDDYGFMYYPQGLYDTVMYVHSTYPGIPMMITENGISKKKWGNYEEERKDEYRIDYMREHLREASRAIAAGAPLKGYFCWSVMETNELRSGGYEQMFGLTQVNYETKERFPRDSWYYYQKVIANCEVD